MEAARSSETAVFHHHTTRHNNPENHEFRNMTAAIESVFIVALGKIVTYENVGSNASN
jgi:hypothetical protein